VMVRVRRSFVRVFGYVVNYHPFNTHTAPLKGPRSAPFRFQASGVAWSGAAAVNADDLAGPPEPIQRPGPGQVVHSHAPTTQLAFVCSERGAPPDLLSRPLAA